MRTRSQARFLVMRVVSALSVAAIVTAGIAVVWPSGASARQSAAAPAGASGAASPAALMNAAAGAARWIDASAVRSERGVVWPADPADPKTIPTNLYSGSTGVVLYYLELHHATGERAY